MNLRNISNLAWAACLALALPISASCGGSDSGGGGGGEDQCGGKCAVNQVCDRGQCVDCIDDGDCTDPAKGHCREIDNVCVQCTDSDHCAGGKVCKNSVCQTGGATVDPECTNDTNCPGTEVCEDGECQTCRVGSCNAAGNAMCVISYVGGAATAKWDTCASGVCQNGVCQTATQECTPGVCYSSTARCSDAGKIVGCQGNETCSGNVCSDPASGYDCTPGACATETSKCTDAGKIQSCGTGNYCSANVCKPYCGDGAVNNGEECDGTNLGGNTCVSLGYSGGTLSCSQCKLVKSGCTSASTSTGIQSARDAVNAFGEIACNVAIKGATVTLVRPQVGDDEAGFFIQEGPTGPAIFVNASAGSGSPAVGDKVNLTATKVTMDEVRRIIEYTGYSKVSSGNDISKWGQELAAATDVTDVSKYESELLETTVTLTTGFGDLGGAGTGFKKAGIKTYGYTPSKPSVDFVIRLPESVAAAIEQEAASKGKKVVGCDLIILNGIYWGYDTSTYPREGCTNCTRHDTQISLYDGSELNYLADCDNAEEAGGGGGGSQTGGGPEVFDYHESWKGLAGADSSKTDTFASQDVSGVTWSYTGRPIGSTVSNMAFERGIVLSNAGGQGVTSTAISGGIKDLTVAFGKASSSNKVRCIKVTVNGKTYKSPPFTSSSDAPYTTFTITGINGINPLIKVEMNQNSEDGCGGATLMVGDIWWTKK